MALPIILINSATGSDSLASGAGPATAITGVAGVSAADGLSVVVDSGTNISGVAVDGSAVLYFADATAGARNFSKIVGSSGSGGASPTFTLSDAVGISLTKSWAVGGKRASILGTNSSKLLENNATNGDAMPGWIIEMESGHSETRSTTTNFRRSGDSTGEIIWRGASGAAVMPLLIFSNNGVAIAPRALLWTLQDFEVQNSNATKTASSAIAPSTGSRCTFKGIKCDHATNFFWKGFVTTGSFPSYVIERCSFQNTANIGIDAASCVNIQIKNNIIKGCGSHGIVMANLPTGRIIGNIIAFNGGSGINSTDVTTTLSGITITGNVIHGNAADGITFATTSAELGAANTTLIENNQFSFNGGYDIDFTGSGITDLVLKSVTCRIRNNGFFGSTSGEIFPTTLTLRENSVTVDPSTGLASATKDYAGVTGGSNFMSAVNKAKGYPIGDVLAVGTYSSSYNYQDIGLGHKDVGGGGVSTVYNQTMISY